MVKYLVSDSTGDHLPYTDTEGKPDHRLMGGAWAALHGGYRGNKYEGPSKDAAIARLKGVYKAEGMDTPQESAGQLSLESITEAYDASTGLLSLTVIKPGFNKGKGRFYPAEVLKRDHKIFDGAKMFADHATEAEQRARPEGSVRNWVATIKQTTAEADGTVKAQAVVHDPQFKGILESLAKNGLISEMGVSIRAVGKADRRTHEGVSTAYVEGLEKARSVDFVTFPGAGGRVDAIEAELFAESFDYQITKEPTTMNEAEIAKMKADLAKATADVATLTTANAGLAAKIQESETAAKKAEAQVKIKAAVDASKLPEPSKARLIAQFKEAAALDGVEAAIATEAEYVKALGKGPGVKGMGAEGGQGGDDAKPDFSLLGLNEAEAKIANAGRPAQR